VSLFGVVGQASAHEPNTIRASEPFTVEKPDISYALYGTFETGDEVFEVRLSFEEAYALPFELLVPHKSKWQGPRPMFAVVGPGLPEPTEAERALLPRDVPEGAGVYVELNDDAQRHVIFESFTRRVFWSSSPIALRLLEGDYTVWIWSPEGTAGDLVLSFGVEEGGDFFKVFDNWSQYAY